MEDKLFTLLGLGVPFYLAAATYAVFSWLDTNASDEATKVISSWLHGRSHNKPDLGNLIINAFDRIYTSPILSFRAFRRSAAISSVIWLLIVVFPLLARLPERYDTALNHSVFSRYPSFIFTEGLITSAVVLLAITIISDYASLPFVRRFLRLAQTYPLRARVVSSIVGLVVVGISFCIFMIIVFIATAHFLYPYLSDFQWSSFTFEIIRFAEQNPLYLFTLIHAMSPAFVIHLWLPLFALSSLLVKLVFWLFPAVKWAQWFLKQGDAHPLKAIGIVATIIIFGSAMLVKEGWTVL